MKSKHFCDNYNYANEHNLLSTVYLFIHFCVQCMCMGPSLFRLQIELISLQPDFPLYVNVYCSCSNLFPHIYYSVPSRIPFCSTKQLGLELEISIT